MRFALPRPSGTKGCRIFPVFIPFAGCPHRCLFCAQERQTGLSPMPVSARLTLTRNQLLERGKAVGNVPPPPVDLAFYGGTFTALPRKEQEDCLSLARWAQEEGLVHEVRCSTRPDALDPAWLITLKDMGLDLVEVGVQSFSDHALAASQRGYNGENARQGCYAVHEAGLALGIQLLPGMPALTPKLFLDDVRKALLLTPSCMRMYPCLVIRDTPLADLWQQGHYIPWSLDTTVSTLGQALALAWEEAVPVIRLSLAPETTLEAALLAGPRHPALGSLIQAEALLLRVQATLPPPSSQTGSEALPPLAVDLRLPAYCRGFFAGHKGALRSRWQALGIDPATVSWHTHVYGEWVPRSLPPL